MLETARPDAGSDGESGLTFEMEPPEIDMPLEKGLAVLREMDREVVLGRKRGRMPTVAPNAELEKALVKALKAMKRRIARRDGGVHGVLAIGGAGAGADGAAGLLGGPREGAE
jgi:hypothetical protein